jgi:hypothetical protein
VCGGIFTLPHLKKEILWASFSFMNPQEISLINELFDRIAQSASQQRDPEAEQLIEQKMAACPHAPYVLAQSTIVLQQAVSAAQAKIASLEQQLSGTGASRTSQGGGFLSGVANLFAPSQPAPARPVSPPPVQPAQQVPQQAAAAPQGSGFLQNAMATAAGVAGGALLFQGIEGLMGHGGGFGSSGFGGEGFMGGNQPSEVVNNYYMDGNNDPTQSDNQDQGQDQPQAQGDAFANNDSSDFDSSDFDSGDDGSGGDFGGDV